MTIQPETSKHKFSSNSEAEDFFTLYFMTNSIQSFVHTLYRGDGSSIRKIYIEDIFPWYYKQL